eukprot:g15294.t1
MDVNRNDYVCIFRNNAGYERRSVAVKPDRGSDLRCVTPSFGSTLTLTTLILQENNEDVLWRGSDTWHRMFNFARPFYFGFNTKTQVEVAYYYNDAESKNHLLNTFGGQKKTQSVSISANFDSTVYILSKNPNKIITIDTMTSQVQFVSPQMSCTSSSCRPSMSISAMECDPRGKLFGIISDYKQLKFAQINPISGKVTVKKDLSLSGIAHGVSAKIDYNMIVLERPSNYLWTINMLDSHARRWYAKPSNLIIHSLEYVGENYLSGTAFDGSTSQERIVYFRYDSSSTSKSSNVGGGVRQGVSAYDQEAQKFIHHIYSNSKDAVKMVEFEVAGRRRSLKDSNSSEPTQRMPDEKNVELVKGEFGNENENLSHFDNHTTGMSKGRRLGYVKVAFDAMHYNIYVNENTRFDFKDAKGTLKNELEQIKRMRGLHPKSVKKHRKRVRVDNIRRTNQLPLNNIKAANTGKIVRISPVADFFSPPQSEKKSKLSTKNVKRKSKISAKKVKHEALAEYVEQANDIVENIDAANAFDEKFVFIAYGNDAFLPFFKNWICNTAKMKGVHARTLILATSLSMHKTLSQNRFNVRVSHLNLGRSDFNRNLDYDTYGYWKLVQLRVQALGHILYSGVSMLLFEPDAIWAQNPLEDRELFTPGYDIIGFSDDQGGMGFGWLLLKSNPKTIFLWKQVLRMTTAEISKFKGLRSRFCRSTSTALVDGTMEVEVVTD